MGGGASTRDLGGTATPRGFTAVLVERIAGGG